MRSKEPEVVRRPFARARLLIRILGAEVDGDVDELRRLVELRAELPPSAQQLLVYGVDRAVPLPERRELLEDMASTPNAGARQEALRALWKMANPASVGVFCRALDDDDSNCRMWALYGLENISGPTAAAGLLTALASPHPELRHEAMRLLQRSGR